MVIFSALHSQGLDVVFCLVLFQGGHGDILCATQSRSGCGVLFGVVSGKTW